MREGEFKLALQTGRRAFFAKIKLEAEERSTGRPSLDATVVEPYWEAAVAFGVALARERCRTPTGHVRVIEVQTNPVDSTQTGVAFASYMAACAAFGCAPDPRVRLRDDGIYELHS